MKSYLINLIRAVRLPFVTASVLPFLFGSLISRHNFNASTFCLGFIGVVSVHLSANLLNDYADSKTGADWQDKTFYNFFGGSKLIQEGVFSENFYLALAMAFSVISFFSILALAVILKSIFVMLIFLIILALSWAYSVKPFQFSYHQLGETAVFILFGPALVMGGYFIQTGIFPDMKSFMLSVPFGFFTAAILYANEIPDFQDDLKVGKFTWVRIAGHRRAYILYCLLTGCAFLSIVMNVAYRFLNPMAIFSLILIFAAARGAMLLRRFPDDKKKLMESSKLTIMMHALASVILIIGVIS